MMIIAKIQLKKYAMKTIVQMQTFAMCLTRITGIAWIYKKDDNWDLLQLAT